MIHKVAIPIIWLLALLLAGCGGGSGNFVNSTAGGGNTLYSGPALPYEDNPLYYQQWYFHYDANFYAQNGIDANANIHPPVMQEYTGKGVKVAIIDNALDTAHEDLQDAVIKTYNAKNGSSDVTPSSNDQTHGTEVTGIIGARSNHIGISGIAPEASLIFIRIPFDISTSDSTIINAFYKAESMGADIINCSWGSGDVSDAVKSAIQDVATKGRGGKGIIVVFASGNDDEPMDNDESAIDEVIGVGATDKNNERAYYSNYGPDLDIMAPGGATIGLTTLDLMGNAGRATLNDNYLLYDDGNAFAGTSASAPVVTGVVAQLLQADPSLTRKQVQNILISSADKIGFEPYDANGRNDDYGYGKIDLSAALAKVD